MDVANSLPVASGNIVQRSQQGSNAASDSPLISSGAAIDADRAAVVLRRSDLPRDSIGSPSPSDTGAPDLTAPAPNFGAGDQQLQIFPTVLDLSNLHPAIVTARLCMSIVAWVLFMMHMYRLSLTKLGMAAPKPVGVSSGESSPSPQSSSLSDESGGYVNDAGESTLRWNDGAGTWDKL